MARNTENQSKSLGRNTYLSILDAIRDGTYRPGAALREEEVAARLNVSRTPVREALGRLQEKGLLEAAPGRGLAVAALSSSQIFELYAMREEMEGIVARYAAHHATDAEIANLERINASFAAAQGDANAAARFNREFHARLYEAARNRYLQHAVEDLHETIALLSDTTFSHPGRTGVAADEHSLLIEAIRQRDTVAAQARAVEHIREALKVRLILSTHS
ncbi:GntR family transcriptional regulator [Rhizobium sp. 1AS11]|uniref:GntR family transcriptional regulator n=1 Tax=Rhizobium acaciae TaxID=2989736 RepID=UPI00222349A0|nr:GntR family transcriptional regulator [Rhizobium acaciae]MCW1411266.1 GntR family transcriptional regulator [Rhizobium acaciae]MCW1743322.1 GntR family transcriptional regulator [Rhizobium acaciae]